MRFCRNNPNPRFHEISYLKNRYLSPCFHTRIPAIFVIYYCRNVSAERIFNQLSIDIICLIFRQKINILRGGKIDRLAQKDAKTLCFAPSGLNSKRRYLFGANTFHDVIGYLCTHRQLPVKLAYSRFRDESKPATSLKFKSRCGQDFLYFLLASRSSQLG